MRKNSKGTRTRYDISNVGDIPLPGEMPSPPEHLIQQQRTRIAQSPIDLIAPAQTSGARPMPPSSPGGAVLHQVQSKNIDYMIYKQAVEDRTQAEMNYAEAYSRNLELTAFNEKLLRSKARFHRFKTQVRALYDAAIEQAEFGDRQLLETLKLTQRDLVAAERAMAGIQIENETLRISVSSHEAGYQELLGNFVKAEKAIETANTQFRALVDEFENRGILLEEADRRIRAQLSEVDQLQQITAELNERNGILREESEMWQNKARELQLREAGVTALNNELAEAMKKSQKQLHELEDRLQTGEEASRIKIAQLESEVARLRESKTAEDLIEKSRLVQLGETPAPAVKEIEVSSKPKENPRAQWSEFYSRWSQIIDGLSSHSTPLDNRGPQKPTIRGQLMSENGDLEIL